jgi:hypothetical protein
MESPWKSLWQFGELCAVACGRWMLGEASRGAAVRPFKIGTSAFAVNLDYSMEGSITQSLDRHGASTLRQLPIHRRSTKISIHANGWALSRWLGGRAAQGIAGYSIERLSAVTDNGVVAYHMSASLFRELCSAVRRKNAEIVPLIH